jgi:hypothetical protein
LSQRFASVYVVCIRANAIDCRDGTDSGRLALIYSIDLGAQKAGGRSAAAQSPEATRVPSRTFIDAALALDEITQRFIQLLVFCSVPQHSRPLASHPIIDLVWIGRAKDHSGKRFRLPYRSAPLQLQRPMSVLDFLLVVIPPRHQLEDRRQITIDCIAIAAGLYRFPLILEAQQTRFQRFG